MGGKCSILNPGRRMRFSRKSQFAKLGSINTFKSVNWTRNEAWPIQVRAIWPLASLGNTGCLCCPVRLVRSAFQTISLKNVRGLKCLLGVKSLKDRGNRRRGRCVECFWLCSADIIRLIGCAKTLAESKITTAVQVNRSIFEFTNSH